MTSDNDSNAKMVKVLKTKVHRRFSEQSCVGDDGNDEVYACFFVYTSGWDVALGRGDKGATVANDIAAIINKIAKKSVANVEVATTGDDRVVSVVIRNPKDLNITKPQMGTLSSRITLLVNGGASYGQQQALEL